MMEHFVIAILFIAILILGDAFISRGGGFA